MGMLEKRMQLNSTLFCLTVYRFYTLLLLVSVDIEVLLEVHIPLVMREGGIPHTRFAAYLLLAPHLHHHHHHLPHTPPPTHTYCHTTLVDGFSTLKVFITTCRC
jgi:hypothetical protein